MDLMIASSLGDSEQTHDRLELSRSYSTIKSRMMVLNRVSGVERGAWLMAEPVLQMQL